MMQWDRIILGKLAKKLGFPRDTLEKLTRTAPRDLYDMHNMVKFGLFDDNETDMLRKCAVFYSAIGAEKPPVKFKLDNIGNVSKQQIKRDLTQVLLVDEATAALDKQTAHQVSGAILGLDGITGIVVTHSLDESLMKQYDGILTLKNGSIVEAGTFDELIAEKGYFYSLFTISQ